MSGGLTLAGRAFTQEHLLHILVHARLDTVEGLGVALQDWNSASRAVSDTLRWKVDAATLQVINRPGAWLLDCIHTQQVALQSARPLHVHYLVTVNKHLKGLMQRLRERTPVGTITSWRGSGYGASCNNVGNQLEYLAWLALENDKPERILALAWHASA